MAGSKLQVLGFGIVRDILGEASAVVHLDNATPTVRDLRQALLEKYPEIGSLAGVMIAVNKTYATDDQVINAADEIAIIPPTSGG